jgi:hypothetical protein
MLKALVILFIAVLAMATVVRSETIKLPEFSTFTQISGCPAQGNFPAYIRLGSCDYAAWESTVNSPGPITEVCMDTKPEASGRDKTDTTKSFVNGNLGGHTKFDVGNIKQPRRDSLCINSSKRSFQHSGSSG